MLGVEIVTGLRSPGSVLPTEIELATRLNISRSVVREALRVLTAKGLVESRQKSGTRVRERAQWALLDPELLEWMFEAPPPRGFVRSLYQLRMIVEPAAAELAATTRSARQLSRMGHALETMQQRGLATQEGQTADQQFHAVLLEATGNELLINLSASIAAAVRWTTFFKYQADRHPRDPIPEHRRLFEAVVDSDGPGARDATIALIEQAQLDIEAVLAT